jgi:hypothetical protein
MHRQDWGRYDTLGRTYYLAESAECAYAEVLSTYKRLTGTDDPLAPIAAIFGITVEELLVTVAEEWGEVDYRHIGVIPPTWRSEHRLHSLSIDDGGWLVDIQHPASIAALEAAHDGGISRFLANQGIPSLNVSVLTSENRLVTTMLAEMIRDTRLDDNTTPRGIHFGSKHGGAWCRAIWLPDDEVMPPGLSLLGSAQIDSEDTALQTVAGWFRLRTTPDGA